MSDAQPAGVSGHRLQHPLLVYRNRAGVAVEQQFEVAVRLVNGVRSSCETVATKSSLAWSIARRRAAFARSRS